MKLLNAIRSFLLQQGREKTYWIAFSGGLDSQVLLSLCQTLKKELTLDLRAIHINHGLSPNALNWSLHCEKTCEILKVDFIHHAIQLDLKPGDSLEQVARDQRYRIFSKYINENDVLLTAHHQDDQAETLLLQLCRGAGVKGLSAMPSIKKFSLGRQARPLLNFSRNELQDYAKENNLSWIEDESNQNENFSRNFIRHQVLSVLKLRWPSVASSIARSAAHCAENQLLLEEVAQKLCEQAKGSRANTLSVKKLLTLNHEQQKCVLRQWIQNNNSSLPNTKILQTIQNNVLLSAWDKRASLRWGGVNIRRHRDDIYLLPDVFNKEKLSSYHWQLEQDLHLPHGCLQVKKVKNQGLSNAIQEVTVSFRQGGEVVTMPQRGGSHTLKKLFQEWQILPWERDFIPLIYVSGKLIAVVGYFLHEDFQAKKDEVGRDMIFLNF